jgi:urease gamma subunit
MTKYIAAILVLLASCAVAQSAPQYKLVATSRTSTMEKEINEAAREGYQVAGTMGGDTHEGEIITIMRKLPDGDDKDRFQYKLLATERTGTMQRELQEAADQGYEYAGVMARGEVMVILERDKTMQSKPHSQYRLLATSRTGTMEKELNQAAADGFEFMGLLKRGEVMAILRKLAQ